MALPRLSARGWTLVASGVSLITIAVISSRRDLLFLGGLVCALPLLALLGVALWRLRYTVSREFTAPLVPAGSSTTVRVRLRNRGQQPGSGTSWRELAPADCSTPPQEPLITLAAMGRPGDRTTLEYLVRPRRRGIVSIGPFLLTRQDPFALAQAEYAIGESSELIVTPRVTPLPGSGLSIASTDGIAREQRRHSNPNSDELIAREYRPGDSMRRVHWPATARRGEIMVRQEEQRSKPETCLVLDTGQDWRGGADAGAGERSSRHAAAFETAIECAASIGVHLLDSGFRLDLIETTAARPVSFRAPGGDRELLERLANVEQQPPPGGAAATTAALNSPLWRDGRRVPLLAVLVDPDQTVCAELATLRPHGDPAIAIVQDTLSVQARNALEHAGWRLVTLHGPRHIGECWAEIRSGSGVRSG